MFRGSELLLRMLNFWQWPLLINVIKGDLSLIGPKAETREIVAQYTDEQKKVLRVKPGIWGPFHLTDQGARREGVDDEYHDLSNAEYYKKHVVPQKVAMELQYIENKRMGKNLRLFLDVLKTKMLRFVNEKLLREAQTRNFFLPIDFVLVALSYLLAYELRFDWNIPAQEYAAFLIALPFTIVFRIGLLYMVGIYRNLWKYMGIRELLSIISAMTISSALIVVALFFIGNMEHSRTVFLIDWLLAIFMVGGSRLLLRLSNENVAGQPAFKRNVVIVGADDVGAALLKMLTNGQSDYNVVGLVDDDDTMHGGHIHGVKVLGPCESIPSLCRIFRVEEVFITGARLSAEQMKKILKYCTRAKVRHKIVPAVSDLLSGNVHLSKGREVEISDLFGREPVKLDLTAIQSFVSGKTVLVTGSGGSIGSELCRQIAEYQPESLILVDKNENYLFEIQCELVSQYPELTTYCKLCSITNKVQLRKLFEQHKPDTVFHAAAHKHVPLSENNPEEAVWNNVIGSKSVADLAHEFGVREFVMVSTDKAVNPTSVMGVTKRIAELYMQALSKQSSTRYVTVRFGNVLNSNGSVIPVFRKQIAKGGPITITHPDVERYFMSIAEAVQLILQAVTMGNTGEVFVLEMGKSIRIVDLAHELILQSGLKPEEDIEIKFTGLRPGEKLYEELVGTAEEVLPTSHSSIKTLQINQTVSKSKIDSDIDTLLEVCRKEDFDLLLNHLQMMIPEFSPPNHPEGRRNQTKNGKKSARNGKSRLQHAAKLALSN